jgi:hypothetical protein
MSTEGGGHVPDLILEQYRLNELPREETDRIERLLRTDRALRRRLEALEQSDDEIARQYPPEWLARRVRERMPDGARVDRPRAGGVRRWALGSAVAAAAVMVVFLVPWSSIRPTADDDRIKGPTLSPTLAVYRRTAQGSETLADGAVARPGDLLRLGYVSAGRGYGAILSIDGRGMATLHLPPNGTRAASLRSDGTILLDHAYELDDAPAWECFYFVTAEHPFDVGPILDAARRAATRDLRSPPRTLPIPRELGQSSFSVQKEVRP